MKTWVNNTLDQDQVVILLDKKELKSDAGMKNQFKKTHTKDRENKNVTKSKCG